ncbi:MAG: class I SAM-dependent methyltransferase [Erysipelotrichaceae bacterium]|nr:class I SAM-dependent methyltransferase [Erysipelotrichaceae bacterium]
MLMMVDYVHQRIATYNHLKIGIDFTMGNGHDTLFLSDICEYVYSFDIQRVALDHTRQILKNDNVQLILDGHENFDYYVTSFDVGVFNLGYLPNRDHNITTKLDTTQIAITKAIQYMNQVLFIVVYPGHEEGHKESLWIDDYVSSLDTYKFNVSKYCMLNKNLSPYVIEIEKKQI